MKRRLYQYESETSGYAVLLDLLPGATVNLDHKQSGTTAWGFSYGSRVAVYKVIPQSALVGEVFGTAGQASSPFSYRCGVRRESPKWIAALTYSGAFGVAQVPASS